MKINKKDFHLIITIGPSSLKDEFIGKAMRRGSVIFRINGAHGTLEYVENVIKNLRRISKGVKILIDLPGNKIRTKDIMDPMVIKKNEAFNLLHSQINYPAFYRHLKRGDVILANDSNVKLEVSAITGSCIGFISHSDGCLENNKGLHIAGIHDDMPFLFDKDLALIDLAIEKKADYLGLAFVRHSFDVKMVKDILARKRSRMAVISKIEKIEAIKNLKGILQNSDYVLIDRGDLSAETGLIKLPYYQDVIIREAAAAGVKVFIATQILKNMQTHPVPLIAEVSDLYNILQKEVYGVQLSEETAIGAFPAECITLVSDMLDFIKMEAPDL